jgi:hypothetical protein
MANRRTVITADDDLTGNSVVDAQEIKITIGDASGSLDLGPDSLDALTSLVNGEGPDKLRALLAPPVIPAKRASGKRSGSRDGNPETTAIRQWAIEHGHAVNARGRVPAEVRAAYNAAHGAKPAITTPAPSSVPAAPADPAPAETGNGKPARK